jgi:hypothetical protein
MKLAKNSPLLAFATLMHVSADAYAQAGTASAAPDSGKTVVTLYSETQLGPRSAQTGETPPVR